MTDEEFLRYLLRNIFSGTDGEIDSVLASLRLGTDGQPLGREALARIDRLIAEMISLRAWIRRDNIAGLAEKTRMADLLDHWARRN